MDLYKALSIKARNKQKTIILPESYDNRILEAVKIILKKKLARIILIRAGEKIPVTESKNLVIIDIGFANQFAKQYVKISSKRKPDISTSDAELSLRDPMTFACLLLKNNYADAVVAGSVYDSGHVIKNAIRIIGLSKNNKTVSSFFLFTFPTGHKHKDRILAYSDSGVIPNPDSSQLSDIAIQTAANYHKLTHNKPKVAFLSFSTKGSAKDKTLEKVITAYNITTKREPNLICDGELQFDAAFVPHVAERKNRHGSIKGDANIFVFPDLNAGNIAYKITERIGGAIATGPIIQGLAKPVMDLSRGCTARDIVNMVIIAVNI